MLSSNTVKILSFGIMADLGLYENFLEHARLEEALMYRRRNGELRNLELAFEMPDSEFIGLYRLNKCLALNLIREIEPYLPSKGGLSTLSKVLTTLSFYASGSYQRFIGASAHHKMHQVSVSNCIRAVTLVLNNEHFRKKYIYFPQNRQERNLIKHGFYQKFGFPGILGCIDGTHVAVVRPSEYEERFFNRKRYHSINAQLICDSDLNIISIDASHGGASHDSYVWNSHPIKTFLENLHASENETLWLLGDSGYPLRATLLTPVVNTEPDTPERYYTDMHCKVRNSVERCIGVLKSRWRCLLVDRKLHYHPTMAGYITNACVVLHNIVNSARLPVPELTLQQEQYEATMQVAQIYSDPASSSTVAGNSLLAAGQATRDLLMQRLWLAR